LSSVARFGRALFLLGALVGCRELPELPAGVCGNGVIESDEDCDTFSAYPGSRCRKQSEADACHLDCSLDEQGARPPCPKGWGRERRVPTAHRRLRACQELQRRPRRDLADGRLRRGRAQ
jgi:hypothetical protein